jgi:hypothetical protein
MEKEILQPVQHTFCDICGSNVNVANGSTGTSNHAGEDINLCHRNHIAPNKK